MRLEVRNIAKFYPTTEKDYVAVKDVSFSLEEGKLGILTGPSGCGKSTLFHLISGLVRPSEGQIFLDEQEISALKPGALAALRNRHLGYVLQSQNLLPNFTLMENVCMPAYLDHPKADVREYARHLLDQFGLSERVDEYPAHLSGGEQRRVAIARAAVRSPKLILADEPTNDLDEENAQMIVDFLKDYCQEGNSVLLSTHEKKFVDMADCFYRMEKGTLCETVYAT